MIKLKDILGEIYYRINEATEIQQAIPDSSADWLATFNDMPNEAGEVDLLMWWSDVYHDMGNTLAYYKKQIELGYKLNQFHNDIKQLIQYTNKCVDKVKLIVPKAFNNVDRNSLILNNIKDDIVQELKELLKLGDYIEMSDVANHIEKIANTYAVTSEALVEQTWDYSDEDETELASSDDFNKYASANLRINNPSMPKTPWLNYKPSFDGGEFSPAYVETRNKFLQGYSLMDIYNWWMSIIPLMGGYMGSITVGRALWGDGWQNSNPLITLNQKHDFTEYVRRADPDRFTEKARARHDDQS